MYDVVALTPTGDRPDAFALCRLWMERQVLYGMKALWLVVDDGEATRRIGLPHKLANGMVVRKIPVDNRDVPGQTLITNLRIGLDHLLDRESFHMIAIVEDDDWYSPEYLSEVRDAMDGFDLVGTTHGRYYHVGARRWCERGPSSYSSLCRTAFSGDAVHLLRSIVTFQRTPFIDVDIWAEFPRVVKARQLPEKNLCISIKGMPGRKGIGALHRPAALPHADPDGRVLKEWIGPYDSAAYAPLYARKETKCRTSA